MEDLVYPIGRKEAEVVEVKVRPGILLNQGKVVIIYKTEEAEQTDKLKSKHVGKVEEVLVKKGDKLTAGMTVLRYRAGCSHPTIMKDMCAECGADLRKVNINNHVDNNEASVSMVHAIPELKVSTSEAASLGREDQTRLTRARKLVLLVDLDQTLIHTTNDNIPPNMKDVYHFKLYGSSSPWYHTRIRPGTAQFLTNISSMYELHICTFGARLYAHRIAAYLDPEGKFFSHRILSRDECFDNRSKTANMSALFPCGDSMVCIIDDREDVWNFAPNLVHVKPYHFFKTTGDINAPPGLAKKENDDKEGFDFSNIDPKRKVVVEDGKATSDKDVKNNKEDSSSDDDTPASAEPRRDSIDMPTFDGNSRDNFTNDDNQNNVEKTMDQDEPIESTKDDEQIGDDLEISDSDSSSGKKTPEPPVFSKEDNKENSKSKIEKEANESYKVEDKDDYLLYLEDILKTVHKAYYDLFDQTEKTQISGPDLKNVMPYVKRKALQGVHIVFSGVVPTQVPLERSKPFLLARTLGATVSNKVDIHTTHLVAARLGTAKVNDARRQGRIELVTPDWLWACAERWERVSEKLFVLSRNSNVTRRPPAHCSSPEIAFAERCANVELNLDGNLDRQPSVVEADPFLAFSTEDLAGMDKEVEDILSGESDSDSDDPETTNVTHAWGGDSSSEDSMTGDKPRGHKRKSDEQFGDPDNCRTGLELDSEDTNLEPPVAKFKRGEAVPSDYELEHASDDSDREEAGGQEDWSLMGAELEAELSN